MKTLKIGKLEFNITACKKLSKKEFYKVHERNCNKYNVDIDYAYDKVVGKKLDFEIVGRRPGDPDELYAATELAEEKLNWTAQYSGLDSIFSSMVPVYMEK